MSTIVRRVWVDNDKTQTVKHKTINSANRQNKDKDKEDKKQ